MSTVHFIIFHCLWCISCCCFATIGVRPRQPRHNIGAKPSNSCVIIQWKWVTMLETLAPMCPSLFFYSSYRPWVLLTLLIFPSQFFCFSTVSLFLRFFSFEKFITWHLYLGIRVHPVRQKQHLAKAEDFGMPKCSMELPSERSLSLRSGTSIKHFYSLFFRDWTRDNHNRPEEVPVWAERAVRSGGFTQQQLAWGQPALIKESGHSRRLQGMFVDLRPNQICPYRSVVVVVVVKKRQ